MTHKQLLDKLTTKHGLLLNCHMVHSNGVHVYNNLTAELVPCTAYKAKKHDTDFDFIYMRKIDAWLKIIIIKEHTSVTKDMQVGDIFEDGEWTEIIENWTQDVEPIQIDIAILKPLTQAYKLANYN